MNNGYLKEINDALIFPAVHDWSGGLYLHGISEASQLNLTDMGQYKFGKSLIDFKGRKKFITINPKSVIGKWLYLGASSSHFGHYMSECTSRMWALENISDCLGVIVLNHKFEQSKKLTRETFRVLNYQNIKINFIESLSVVETL